MGISLRKGGGRFGREWRKQDRVTRRISPCKKKIYFFFFLYNVLRAAGVCCLGGRLNCKVLRETLLQHHYTIKRPTIATRPTKPSKHIATPP